MCLFRSRCNTVPIEKGTETRYLRESKRWDILDATPSPSRRGLKPQYAAFSASQGPDATPSPSRRGLKRASDAPPGDRCIRCNTVPIEKGTETSQTDDAHTDAEVDATPSPSRRGLKPSMRAAPIWGPVTMQHRPHREGD